MGLLNKKKKKKKRTNMGRSIAKKNRESTFIQFCMIHVWTCPLLMPADFA